MTTTTVSNGNYFESGKSKKNYNSTTRSNSSNRSVSPYSLSASNSPQSFQNEDKKQQHDQNDSDSITLDSPFNNKTSSLQNRVSTVYIRGVPVISLLIDGKERLCLAQISNTLLKTYSYNEIHNRRVALGINCIQCTPVQLEILRRTGAMPISSRRCGMITKREAERLVKSFLEDNRPPVLPDNFAFTVIHKCGWGCRGVFYPARYNSSRAKCIRCYYCDLFYSPNKFIFHAHNTPDAKYIQPDTANFNSWRRHLTLVNPNNDDHLANAWEDVKAIFNGGTRKRMSSFNNSNSGMSSSSRSVSPATSRAVDIDVDVSFSENEVQFKNETKSEDSSFNEKRSNKSSSDDLKKKSPSSKAKKESLSNDPSFYDVNSTNKTKNKDRSETLLHSNTKEGLLFTPYATAQPESLPFSMHNIAKSHMPLKTERKPAALKEPQTLVHHPTALSQFMAAAAAAATNAHNYMPFVPSYAFSHQSSQHHEQLTRHNIFPLWHAWNTFDHTKLSTTSSPNHQHHQEHLLNTHHHSVASTAYHEQFLPKHYLSALNFSHAMTPFKIQESGKSTPFKSLAEKDSDDDDDHQLSSKKQKTEENASSND